MLESVKPDIVIGTETWLDNSIKDSEIFPSGYRIHRKDRKTGNGGGVLIAAKEEFNSEDVPELDTDCEIIWTRLKLIGNGTVYSCSFYRHHVSMILFVLLLYVPSQQLWSLRDGQFT